MRLMDQSCFDKRPIVRPQNIKCTAEPRINVLLVPRLCFSMLFFGAPGTSLLLLFEILIFVFASVGSNLIGCRLLWVTVLFQVFVMRDSSGTFHLSTLQIHKSSKHFRNTFVVLCVYVLNRQLLSFCLNGASILAPVFSGVTNSRSCFCRFIWKQQKLFVIPRT